MARRIKLPKPIGFEWDKGNNEKNVTKHKVKITEGEEVFFNNPLLLYDKAHSQKEDRYLAFGITDNKRALIVSFTLRGEEEKKIRIISVRDQDKKEKEYYQTHKKRVE